MPTMAADFPMPEITELNRPFWDALRQGQLLVQRCSCGHAWLPARRECPSCLQPGATWERVSGRGRLYSWVVYHTAYHPAFADRLPYAVALVELDEGPRLLAGVVDDPSQLRGDAPVELLVRWEDDLAVPAFRILPGGPDTPA